MFVVLPSVAKPGDHIYVFFYVLPTYFFIIFRWGPWRIKAKYYVPDIILVVILFFFFLFLPPVLLRIYFISVT